MNPHKVIVVGTTPDYVARLYETYPGRTCFVMDSSIRGDHLLEEVDQSLLLFTNLEDSRKTLHDINRFLSRGGFGVDGVGCFDCESLVVASDVACHLRRPFPPREAVIKGRDKFRSKKAWAGAGVPSPQAALVSGLKETLAFFRAFKGAIVLKPVSGSGSELTFVCRTEDEVVRSVEIMERELPERKSNPLFRPMPPLFGDNLVNSCGVWVAESFVPGPEFSCDFFLEKEQVTVLRQTGKVKAPGQTFGSILAYTFPAQYPAGFSFQELCGILKKAAFSLGFSWGHFMTDFIVYDGRVVILEMTPRPGGDSIPDLVRLATGRDLLGLHLDFVSGRHRKGDGIPDPTGVFASINLYAPKNGVVQHFDSRSLLASPWVKGFFPKKGIGDLVILPPDSYDHRLLGYCVVSYETGSDLVSLAKHLESLLHVSIEV